MGLRLATFALAIAIASPALAVCPPGLPPGVTCNGLENYIYTAPGGAAVAPYTSALRIPVAPGPADNSLQYIPGNLFVTLNDPQTLTGKTIDCHLNTCVNFSGGGGIGALPGGAGGDIQYNAGGGLFGGYPLSSKFTTSGNIIDLAPGVIALPGAVTGIITGPANSGSAATYMRSDASPGLSQTGVGSGLCTNCNVTFDAYGRALSAASGTVGTGTVTSVGLAVPPSSLFTVGGSPITGSGNLSLATTGNSGGIPYFSSATQLNSSTVLASGMPLLGGGAGNAPATGTLSGNTTKLVSQGPGATPAGAALVYDAAGNAVASLPAGSVTSVNLSAPTGFTSSGGPVTVSGTLALGLSTEAANSIWAGPITGTPAIPGFRSLVLADLPTGIPLSSLASMPTSTVVGNSTAGSAIPTGISLPACSDTSGNHLNFLAGTGFTCGNTSSSGSPLSGMTATQIPVAATGTTVTGSVPQSTWLFSSGANSALSGTGAGCLQADGTGAISRATGGCATGGSGSVTSVAATVPTGFTIGGSPITTAGTLAIGLATETANTVWAGPTTGAAAAPTFRALVNNDLPSAGALTLGTTSMALGSTTPSVAALTLTASPSLALRDTSAAFDVTLGATSSPILSAARTLTFDVENGARTVHLGSNLTIATDPGAVTGALKSNGTGTFSQAACSDLAGVGTGCAGTIPAAANPTATIGPTAVNGSAATWMRSDAAPAIGTNAVTNALLAQPTANTLIGNVTSGTANATYVPLPGCTDTSGNHLNYTSGTGFSCGTSSSGAGAGNDTVAVAVTAAGANSTNCQPLTAQFNNVNSVLTGTGVCLQTGTAGGHSIVRNSGANPLFVYAISTAVINNLAATVGVVVQPNQSMYFEALSATQWYSIP